jgi:hypothetical protein
MAKRPSEASAANLLLPSRQSKSYENRKKCRAAQALEEPICRSLGCPLHREGHPFGKKVSWTVFIQKFNFLIAASAANDSRSPGGNE